MADSELALIVTFASRPSLAPGRDEVAPSEVPAPSLQRQDSLPPPPVPEKARFTHRAVGEYMQIKGKPNYRPDHILAGFSRRGEC